MQQFVIPPNWREIKHTGIIFVIYGRGLQLFTYAKSAI